MEDLKLKRAFGRIRTDMELLSARIDELQSVASLNEDIKEDIKSLRKHNIEKFTQDMQNEFRTIELLVEKFNDKFLETSSLIKNFSRKIDEYHREVDMMKKEHEVFAPTRKEVDNKIESKLKEFSAKQPSIEKTLNDFSELVNEKMTLEIAQLKTEFTEEIAKLYDRFFNELMEIKSSKKKKE